MMFNKFLLFSIALVQDASAGNTAPEEIYQDLIQEYADFLVENAGDYAACEVKPNKSLKNYSKYGFVNAIKGIDDKYMLKRRYNFKKARLVVPHTYALLKVVVDDVKTKVEVLDDNMKEVQKVVDRLEELLHVDDLYLLEEVELYKDLINTTEEDSKKIQELTEYARYELFDDLHIPKKYTCLLNYYENIKARIVVPEAYALLKAVCNKSKDPDYNNQDPNCKNNKIDEFKNLVQETEAKPLLS